MYSIKGRISETANAHWVISEAADIEEAIKTAKARGMYEVYSAALTKIREVLNDSTQGGRIYIAKVKEQTATQGDKEQQSGQVNAPRLKTATYNLLIFADNFDKATEIVKEQIRQGYDMVACEVKESRIDDVISVNE